MLSLIPALLIPQIILHTNRQHSVHASCINPTRRKLTQDST